ncbi:MAG: phage holin family protein [Candidatus Paceibacteria bacterium]
MQLIWIPIFQFIANAIAIKLSDALLSGFAFEGNIYALLKAAFIITLLHIVIKPLAKLFLGPFIILSFGLLILAINAILLWLATYWAPELQIATYWDLIIATLIFTAVNFVFWLIGKFAK